MYVRVWFFDNDDDFIGFLLFRERLRHVYTLVYKRLFFRYEDNAHAVWVFTDNLGLLVINYRKNGDKKYWIVVEI